MAREFARYLVSTHRDPDWATLTTTQHDCYMALLSSPDLSWAGVVPYFPARYAGNAADLTPRKVAKAWDSLADANLLVIDHSTGEILGRSFLRHDKVLTKPNVTKAFCRALDRIASTAIRDQITAEVARIWSEEGDALASSWDVIADLLPHMSEQIGITP
ncbi:hypothetical protein ACTNEV_11445 [Oscillospiraceae bacterium HCP3S3_D12]